MINLTIEEIVDISEYGLQIAEGNLTAEQVEKVRAIAEKAITGGTSPFMAWSELATPLMRHWWPLIREGQDADGFIPMYEIVGLHRDFCPTDIAVAIVRFIAFANDITGEALIAEIQAIADGLESIPHKQLRIIMLYKCIAGITVSGLHMTNPALARKLLDAFAGFSPEEKDEAMTDNFNFYMR